MKNTIRKILKESEEEKTITIAGVVFRIDDINNLWVSLQIIDENGINRIKYDDVKAELNRRGIGRVQIGKPTEIHTRSSGEFIPPRIGSIHVWVEPREIVTKYFNNIFSD